MGVENVGICVCSSVHVYLLWLLKLSHVYVLIIEEFSWCFGRGFDQTSACIALLTTNENSRWVTRG
jgi:hypothetical protein